MHLYLSLPLFEKVAREVLGKAGGNVTLRDVSGGRDATLSHILSLLHQELLVEGEGSQLFVEGLAQSLAVHLVRRYSESGPDTPKQNALPGSKLRRAIAFMREHLDEPFDLARLARSVGMSTFHFSRLFKKSIGVSPSRHFIRQRVTKHSDSCKKPTLTSSKLG